MRANLTAKQIYSYSWQISFIHNPAQCFEQTDLSCFGLLFITYYISFKWVNSWYDNYCNIMEIIDNDKYYK